MTTSDENPYAFDQAEREHQASAASLGLLDYLRARPAIMRWKKEGIEALALKPNHVVADIGCGTGEDSRAMASQVVKGRVIGIDPSAAFLSIARQRHAASGGVPANVSFELGSILKLPFDDNSIDACFVERVISHLEDPAVGLREVRRVLKPGGLLRLADDDNSSQTVDTSRLDVVEHLMSVVVSMIKTPRAGKELYGWLVKTGFEIVSVAGEADIQTGYDPAFAFAWPDAIREQAIARKLITQGDFDALQDDLRRADSEGRFFASYIRYNILAKKPRA